MGNLTDWIAIGIASLALGLSWYTVMKTRDSVSLRMASAFKEVFVVIINSSPHAVSVTNAGVYQCNGHHQSLVGENGINRRVESRGTLDFSFNDNPGTHLLSTLKTDNACVYIELATGQKYYTAGRLSRWCWRVMSWFSALGKAFKKAAN